ncbi:MAG: hypothetical protein ACI4Q9_03380, partial [Candidatus Methanomethylophilaceae archaeon]
MNAKITATIAVAAVAAMVFAAAGAVTYSWFSDSEEANINIDTATVSMSAKYMYCLEGTTPSDWKPVSESSVTIPNVTPNKKIDFTVGNYDNYSTIPVKYYLFVEITAGPLGIQAGHLTLNGDAVPALSEGSSQKYLLAQEQLAVDAIPDNKSFTIATSIDLVQGETFSVKIISEVYQVDAVVSLPAELEASGDDNKVASTYVMDPVTNTTMPVTVTVPNSVEGAASVSVAYVSEAGAASSDKITLDLTMTDASGASIHDFGESVVTIKLTTPYPIGSVMYNGTEAHDFTCVLNSSGTYDVEFTTNHFSEFVLNCATVVVGEGEDATYYSDLSKAVMSAEGKKVTILKDISCPDKLVMSDDQIVNLDLNGHIIDSKYLFCINKGTSGVSITIDGTKGGSGINGRVVANWYNTDFDLMVKGGSYIAPNDYAFIVYGGDQISFSEMNVDAYVGFWLSSNKINSVYIDACNIKADYGGVGIYLATAVDAIISNTTVIADETALEIKSGAVEIRNCMFSSEAYLCDASSINHNGSGAGIAAVVINNAYSHIGCATNVTIDNDTVIANTAAESKQILIIADKEHADYNITVNAVGKTAGIAFVDGSEADIVFNNVNAVASVNGEYYASFSDAFNSLNNESGKITILDSHETVGVELASNQ